MSKCAGTLVMIVLLSPLGFSGESQAGRLLVLGDSLSAGYGLDPELAYPAILQRKIREAGLPLEVFNAGVSGDTSAGGLARINWLLRQPVDVLLLELGANDGLRGIELTSTRSNLQGIIDRTKARYPQVTVVIAGMMVPPNLGPDYTSQFRRLYRDLAADNQATLIPFLLEDVAGRPELNLPDGIHPTPEGHSIIAETVWKTLQPILVDLSQ